MCTETTQCEIWTSNNKPEMIPNNSLWIWSRNQRYLIRVYKIRCKWAWQIPVSLISRPLVRYRWRLLSAFARRSRWADKSSSPRTFSACEALKSFQRYFVLRDAFETDIFGTKFRLLKMDVIKYGLPKIQPKLNDTKLGTRWNGTKFFTAKLQMRPNSGLEYLTSCQWLWRVIFYARVCDIIYLDVFIDFHVLWSSRKCRFIDWCDSCASWGAYECTK